MRKLLLVLLTIFSIQSLQAQITDAESALAKQLVEKNAALIGLTPAQQKDAVISAAYKTVDGLQMVYLQQAHLGIPVYNQLQVLAFFNGKVVSNTGGRLPDIQKLIHNNTALPSVSVVSAVETALHDFKLTQLESAVPIYYSADGHKFEFGKLGVNTENIKADLLWYPIEGKNEVKLVWQVFVTPVNSNDYWLVRVDANTNKVIDRTNLTISCEWNSKAHSVEDHLAEQHKKPETDNYVIQKDRKPFNIRQDLITTASYRVVKYPAESPQHPGGVPSIHTDPWTMAGGNATSLRWNSDPTDYNITRGNNVWAQEDRDNNNSTMGIPGNSTTAIPNLTFDYTYDFTKSPTDPTSDNQQAAIVNLFYWNNIIHDISYLYGFDEPTGNFQNDNQGRGGLGGDYVIADAQDASGTNNANFSTPVDGTRPRMQMYLWTAPNPDRDGDLDASIIVHEFTHGISNRYTGGPANSSCLGNSEQGGEGWSDYFALMSTTNWATATVNDGVNRRGIGTYALNQATNGTGIRRFPYSTDMSIYPLTYADMPGSVVPHGTGEIWCMMLWEMTWAIIQQDNAINPNLFAPGTPATMVGNSAALKLVSEGMRLQPCNPGYVDARNAILRADTLLFNSRYSCSIWKAFAKRGLGRLASQGSASSSTDGIADYTVDASGLVLTESVTQVPEGQNVTYTNTVTAGTCTPVANFFITDTLPTNVTYVSGGNYNAANRTVTFTPVTLAPGATQSYSFTATVNNGTYFAPVLHLNETVPAASIPAAWTATSTTSTVWTTSTTFSNSAPNAFFAPNSASAATDLSLATTAAYTISPNTVSNYTTLSFWHRFNTEAGWDGGVVEISTNNGGTWSDLGSKMISGKYNGSIGTGSALSGRQAFTGLVNAFMKTTINLSSYVGQSIMIRFRFGSDNNTAPSGGGWWVDDIQLYSEPAVAIRSSLFNASSVRQTFSDTITRILPSAGCVGVTITTQPANTVGCIGGNASFSVAANGTSPVYQWQVNTGSGFADIPPSAVYSGTTSSTLSITGVTAAMNSYQYRVVLSNTCTPAFNSTSATLTVTPLATINSQPANSTVCAGATTTFAATATGAASYRWQMNTGSGFIDVPNAAPYSGVTTPTLTITGVTAAMNGYQYRLVATNCSGSVNSNAGTLTISVPLVINAQPASVAVCQGNNVTFNVATTGTVLGYQWQISTNGGTTFTDLPGATTASYSLTPTMLGQNNYQFRIVINGGCGPVTSNAAVLTVNAYPVFALLNVPTTICLTDPAFALVANTSGGTWSGTGITGNIFTPSVAGLGSKAVTYSVTTNGCTTAQSSTVQVNECSDRHLLLNAFMAVTIWPNPSNGRFQIRMNSDLYSRIGMRVYNDLGALVRATEFTGIGYGSVMTVDLTQMPSGTYHLYLTNSEHGFISRGESIIIYRK